MCLDDNFCLRKFNHMLNFLNHLYKTYNFKLYWLMVFFNSGEKLKKEENKLNGAVTWLMSIKEDLFGSSMKHHCSKNGFFRVV